MRVAVVGHCEWVEFLRVPRVPSAGEIVHAVHWWSEPGGGGPGAAVQLAKLAGEASLLTAVGDDDLGRDTVAVLQSHGLHVAAAVRHEPTRRASTFVDDAGERTITVLGDRLDPLAADPLGWDQLDGADGVYLTAGDVAAVRLARRARVLVATSRVLPLLRAAAVEVDALVGSAADPSEAYGGELDPPPRLVVRTEGARGGRWQVRGQPERRYPPAPAPEAVVDRYGAGDSFAAALTYALAEGLAVPDALDLAARCGAAVLTGPGPYTGQLRRVEL